MIKNRVKKYFLIFAGSASLASGIIGVFIPLLPTTPFLLLASLCYIRSSSRLYSWLVNHRIFGNYIYNYITFKAVRKKVKAAALIFLWLALAVSILISASIHLRIFLFIVGIGVSIHLITLKTIKS
jgi:uncharacterized protein